MSLDYAQQVTLGIAAGTAAQWLRDNPECHDLNDKGEGDADEFGMYTFCTTILCMYHELLLVGSVEVLSKLKAPSEGTH